MRSPFDTDETCARLHPPCGDAQADWDAEATYDSLLLYLIERTFLVQARLTTRTGGPSAIVIEVSGA